MSLPPQSGSWQPPQPPQQPTGAPGEQPHGPSYGPPPQGYQQPWYPPPGPPKKGGGAKWVLLGVAALIAIVAVSVAVTVVVLHSNSGDNSKDSTTSTAGQASGIASANDKGPVTVIIDDPSCAQWTPIMNALATSQQNGWVERDPSIPASAWSTEQRTQFQTVATAMRHAADQTVALAKLTPHRVMRELYEQSIAYERAYADSIPDYTANDDHLARVATAATAAIGTICNAITYGSAGARGPLIAAPSPPTQPSSPADPANPQRFLSAGNSVCKDWEADGSEYSAATADWQKTDPNVPASQWSPEQKAANDAVGPVISSYADKFEELGRRSGNPTLEDFAVLSAQYSRAYVQGLQSYVPADRYLYQTASYSNGAINAACESVGS